MRNAWLCVAVLFAFWSEGGADERIICDADGEVVIVAMRRFREQAAGTVAGRCGPAQCSLCDFGGVTSEKPYMTWLPLENEMRKYAFK